jgi:hypothetical protein
MTIDELDALHAICLTAMADYDNAPSMAQLCAMGAWADAIREAWPAVRKRLDIQADLFPCVDRLQEHLERGDKIAFQDERWHLFDDGGEGIVSGATLKEMLVNMLMRE